MADDPVLTERSDDGVLVVTINRPEARNAVNQAVAQGVATAMEQLDDDDDLRVGIITGAGGTFCSGMDLKAFLQGERPHVKDRGFAGVAAQSPRKPLIAAVEGWALAGGFELALSCDLVVAAEDARFGIPEIKRGLFAGAGAVFRLPKRIPYHLAMELALTGDPIGAKEAHGHGLVNRLTPPGGALEGARKLGLVIAANAPISLVETKAVVQQAVGWTEPEAWELQEPHMERAFQSEDAKEGARAFAEKRDPVWQGR